ncbi:hypothetical protein MKW92_014664 [Papaver armeniacum]|nr:hypothetical protein MKW92_014664 [Papaver armeniacum]
MVAGKYGVALAVLEHKEQVKIARAKRKVYWVIPHSHRKASLIRKCCNHATMAASMNSVNSEPRNENMDETPQAAIPNNKEFSSGC